MPDESFYHEAQRALQDHFDSRRIADRLEQVTLHDVIAPWDQEMIEAASFFFLSTVDADGWPDVSYKGGDSGFVHVLDPHTLAFPHFDGNGMFRSLGNVEQTAKVAMLFIDFERPNRTRVHGEATVELDGDLLDRWAGAQAAVRVHVRHVFPNCPRYVHRMELVEASPYVPQEGCEAPVPDWKRMEVFSDFLPGASAP
jgi:predicted pyridoxine 5'-phosphate oxidase superfamily flavin-nucleotide-binding protein